VHISKDSHLISISYSHASASLKLRAALLEALLALELHPKIFMAKQTLQQLKQNNSM
jgi:hypothetical protein